MGKRALHSHKFVISTGGVMAFRPAEAVKKRLVQQPLFIEPSPFPLSSRAKPRDLQFRGPFLEMFF
jgi:hypothetical protein